jgi:Cu-Zn family superoxide dismutase
LLLFILQSRKHLRVQIPLSVAPIPVVVICNLVATGPVGVEIWVEALEALVVYKNIIYKMKAVSIWSDKKSKYSYRTSPNIRGFVFFNQDYKEEPVKVVIYITGLEDGLHGIHVHEKGMSSINEASVNCCDDLGGHFNVGEKWDLTEPRGTKHGNHTGDLCMNIMSSGGSASFTYYDDKISLFRGENSIINKSVVVHKNEDDLGIGVYCDEERNINSLLNGNSGVRLCCSEIRKIEDPNF